jgi:hypothetical protein
MRPTLYHQKTGCESMGSTASKVAIVCAFGFGCLLWSGTSPADDDGNGRRQRRAPDFRPSQGQEVVAGFYNCTGTVFTDDQATEISTYTYLNATSGITTNFYGNGQRSTNVPADLDAMAEICVTHVNEVLSQVPDVCTLGPIELEQGEFGNGASTTSRFEFSCQGTRDEVIGVIGGFTRLSLTTRLP